MEDKATLESDLSAIWGFAGEWCLVGTAPFLHLMRDAWYPQNITPLVKPSVKLRVWAEPSVTVPTTQIGENQSKDQFFRMLIPFISKR